jgi:phosphoglycolate phosphatase
MIAPAGRAEAGPVLVMLDYDGVIVDSLEVTCRMASQVLESHGFAQLASRRHILGLLRGNWYEALAEAGVPRAVAQAVDEALEQAVTQDPDSTPPVDGMLDVVRELARRYSLAIVTSSRRASVQAFLDRHGLPEVTEILGSDADESKERKIAWLLRRYPDHGARWLVTDTTGDIREARAAGVRTIGVAWGWHSVEKLRAAGADRIACAPSDLLGLLEGGGSRPGPRR